MTYARLFIAPTNGQQPHVSAQYVAASSISLSRLAASFPPRIATTFGSPPSFINRLTNFALGHNATATPSAAPPSRPEVIKAGNSDACKAGGSYARRVTYHSNRPGGFPPAEAVAPSCGGADLPRVRDGAPIHRNRKAGLARPLCCTNPEGFRQSAKLSRGYVGLDHSLALKPHRSGLILNARDFRSLAKGSEDYGSHRSVSKSRPCSGASPT